MEKSIKNAKLIVWLFVLTFGYVFIWFVLITVLSYEPDFPLESIGSGLVIWYPSAITSFLFAKKFKRKSWRLCFILAMIGMVALSALVFYILEIDSSPNAGYALAAIAGPCAFLGYLFLVSIIISAASSIKNSKTALALSLISICITIVSIGYAMQAKSISISDFFFAFFILVIQVLFYLVTMSLILLSKVEVKAEEKVKSS